MKNKSVVNLMTNPKIPALSVWNSKNELWLSYAGILHSYCLDGRRYPQVLSSSR